MERKIPFDSFIGFVTNFTVVGIDVRWRSLTSNQAVGRKIQSILDCGY
jgi:hypothetical protein